MATRDLLRNILVSPSLSPAVRASTGTGSAVDTRGYDSAVIAVSFGTWTDGTHTPSVLSSVDGTTYNAASASDLDGTFTAVSGTAGANTVQQVGYIGSQRFLKVVMTVASGTSGAASNANVCVGHSHVGPTQ